MAEIFGIKQQSYASWERRSTALKPEQLAALARILECSIDDLIGHTAKTKRGNGPAGRIRRVFEAVSKLPRHQQQKIVDVVETFVAGHQNGNGG